LYFCSICKEIEKIKTVLVEERAWEGCEEHIERLAFTRLIHGRAVVLGIATTQNKEKTMQRVLHLHKSSQSKSLNEGQRDGEM
jgi:hypothetical protein